MKTTEWLEAAEARRVCQLAAERPIHVAGKPEAAERAWPLLSRLLFAKRHTAPGSPSEPLLSAA
jgi:hypothetical protein